MTTLEGRRGLGGAVLPVVFVGSYYLLAWVVRQLMGSSGLGGLVAHVSITALWLAVLVGAWSRLFGGLATKRLGWEWRSTKGDSSSGRAVLVGAAMGVVGFAVLTVAISAARSVWPAPHASPFAGSFTTDNLPAWLAIAWLGGGVREEVLRVFTIGAFSQAWGRRGLWVGVVVQGLLFGVGHLRQGAAAAVIVGMTGLALGFVFVRRRNLVELIVAHGVYDTIGVVLATYVVPQ